MNIKKESKSTLLLLIIIVISLVIIFFFSMGLERLNNSKNYDWIFCFLSYVLLLIICGWLHKKYPNNIIKYLNAVVSFPLLIVLVLFQFTIPIIGLILNITFFGIFTVALPLLIIKLNEYFNYLNITYETNLFITLTFSTSIAVTFCKQILNLLYQIGPVRTKDSEKMKIFNLEELTEYVLNRENIRFIIYSSFFVYLLVFSFQILQNTSVFEIEEKDRAVYQSFLCFLAFDRLLLNSNRFILLPSELLNRIFNSIRRQNKKL